MKVKAALIPLTLTTRDTRGDDIEGCDTPIMLAPAHVIYIAPNGTGARIVTTMGPIWIRESPAVVAARMADAHE